MTKKGQIAGLNSEGIIKYSKKEAGRYINDLKFWSNACGELHHFGKEDITENQLPDDLKPIYKEYWEEAKDGHYTYLAQYKGVNGIALIDEYYEEYDNKTTQNNYAQALKAAEVMSKNPDCTVLLAEGLGFEEGTELVVFMPATVPKDRFDQLSKQLAEVDYVYADGTVEAAHNENIKDIVIDAFNLQDWLSGTMSGGIDAPRIFMEVNPVNDFTVSVKWRNQETCGLSDCRYHNTDLQPHIDTFTLNNNKLSMNGSEVFHLTGWEDDPDIMTKIEEFSQKYHVVI